MKNADHAKNQVLDTSQSLINLLGVVYAHRKTSNDGDLYLTHFGLRYTELLKIENWYEKEWFETHRERLTGTSSVFRVPTKVVNGRHLQLVTKNCRVGEDVPLDTHTLYEFINAEFNSPWEEFALVMEMREGTFGPKVITIKTQQPLAIYIPPERLQLWQTGRSRSKINKITLRHPGINLDILRQYKLVYRWIEGLNIIEALKEVGISDDRLKELLPPITSNAIDDLEKKGYVVADMKPSHIIISENQVARMRKIGEGRGDVKERQTDYLRDLVKDGCYSVIDYELLLRTAAHEEKVKYQRRHIYLDDQRDRFTEAPLPPFLCRRQILDVPYVHGHVESTDGLLWVVGCNPRLFDYFLPERWRKTPCQLLSPVHDVFYTVTKDNVHIVWKPSRVGETPQPEEGGRNRALISKHGFNSPFEEFAISLFLSNNGIPTVYIRAIYMTGSEKIEPVTDPRRYESHKHITGPDNVPILRENRNYITIQGYFNGPDPWVAAHEDQLYKPYDLERAAAENILSDNDAMKLLDITRSRLRNVGCDGSLLELNDILVAIDPNGTLVMDAEGLPEARICNFELIHKL